MGRDYVKIPLDLEIEIMIRLPAKSLMRFKCVSKLWSSLIRSRYLSNLYLTTYASTTPRLFISLVDHNHKCTRSMDFSKDLETSQLISLSSSSSTSASFDQDWNIRGIGGHHMMAHRGLILYTLSGKACLYNPSTRQTLTLPAIVKANINAINKEEDVFKYDYYFLGYDPILDHYKVVYHAIICSKNNEMIDSQYWVFVVEAGGSWKSIKYDQPHFSMGLGICINGVIYYIASQKKDYSVVSFDVRSEEFNMIQVPHEVYEYGDDVDLIEYCEKPTIFDYTYIVTSGSVNLWVLEDDGGIWSKKSMVLKPSCHMHLVDYKEIYVEGTTQKDEVILTPITFDPCYILYYDLQQNNLRKVDIRLRSGISEHDFLHSYIYFKLMDKGESIIHLQT